MHQRRARGDVLGLDCLAKRREAFASLADRADVVEVDASTGACPIRVKSRKLDAGAFVA